MIEQLVQNISNNNIRDFFRRKLPSFTPVTEKFDFINRDNRYENFSDLIKLGSAEYDNSDELMVFSCKYKGELTQRTSKKKQFEVAKKALNEDFKDGAVFIFYDENGCFRFSFIRKHYGDQDRKYTPWRRYTYFVQPTLPNKTFKRRIDGCSFASLDEIQEAFSVEPLSKEFYKALSHWYFYALDQVDFPNDRDEDPHTVKANAMIRLITRIIFVWFMKQSRLVPNGLFDKEVIDKIINYKDKTGSTYYKAILQNLFFATLNTSPDKERKFVNRQYGVPGFFRYRRFIQDEEKFLELMEDIPFLNGGLFENLDKTGKDSSEPEIRIDCFSDRPVNEERLQVPDELFFGDCEANLNQYLGDGHERVHITGLIDLLNRYDFTIDENTPYDQEVALDPELLGMVFENLLASYNPETESTARKESGSFYTPREVVDYMVEEALLEYTVRQTGIDYEILKNLFKNNDHQPLESLEDRKSVINALSSIKLLDPACGSGAFPMGALQKMVHVLGLLDPENKLWEERQKDLAMEETREAFEIGDHEERDLRLDAIKQAFKEGMNDPDYARKLFLIENTMYGVDIQPIAMQISKLRFFISLLVDQNMHADRDNLGIMALPNLETKFVAANTLIRLPGTTGQLTFKDPRIEKLEKELSRIRHELFNARTTKTKEKKRERHEEIQNQMGEILKEIGYSNEAAEAIKNWKAFDPNACADWFDPEWMFALRKFDVVIGNPPYIQLQKAVPSEPELKYADLYKNQDYKTFERTGDIYSLFFEKGLEILKPSGVLCFITSNKWMRANYGKSLRRFLASKKPLKLIDLGPGVFESATVDTCVTIVENRPARQHQLQGLTLRSRNQISAIKPEDMMEMTNLDEKSWIVLKPEEQKIKEKIERLGTPLRDWDIEIYRGISTGYNEAFIIDGATKDKLIAEDPRSDEIIKPILRGRDIKRYKAEFKDLWLIFIPWHFPIHKEKNVKGASIEAETEFKNKYRAIYNHLLQYKEKLSKRNKAETGIRYEWYALQRCAASYYEEFEKEKIIYMEIQTDNKPAGYEFPCYSYDANDTFVLNTAYIMTGNYIKYILGVLNSRLGETLVKYYVTQLQKRQFRMLDMYVKHFPIREFKENFMQIENIVDLILSKKQNNQDTTSEEQQIDLMVYHLYELTYDEVLVIDPEPPFSRAEYENATINVAG